MARTFIGELLLRLKDEASGQAKGSADRITGSMDAIQRAAARLNSAPWGGRFQSQIDKMGASARELDTLRNSWERLQAAFKQKNLSGALRGAEISRWQLGALSHLREMAAAAKAAEDHTGRLRDRINELKRLGLYALGSGSAIYFGGQAIREGTVAASEWQREKFRQEMGNIPEGEKDQIIAKAEELGGQYPSVSITEIAELARNARNMMGSVEAGLEILPDLVKGMVTLQSAKGTDVAVGELQNLLRGIDNAGKNSGGELGIRNTREIIAGLIRAAQVEGADLDVGKLFQFARRGKIAVPGLSTEFLAGKAPAFMQDMTAEGFGAALSSAYQAFVIGSNAVASKKNIAEQERIGIRRGGDLVGADTFGRDPDEWVKQVLIPALKNDGVDMSNETDVAQAVAKLSRNTNATGLITRIITQQEQVNRLFEQYSNAMGPDAADEARFKDPFVGATGFVTSLRNLAAAVGDDILPTATAGMNSMTDAINKFQQLWRDGDPMAKAGIAGSAAMAGYGSWKLLAGLWSLGTAGPALNAAAVSLEAAAVSLAAGGKVGAAGTVAAGAASTTAGGGALAAVASSPTFWTAVAALSAIIGVGLVGRDATKESKKPPYKYYPQGPEQDRDNWQRQFGQVAFEGGRHRVGLGAGPAPSDSIQAAVDQAENAGSQIQQALSVTATPAVDTSALQEAVRLAQQFVATMKAAATVAANAADNVPRTGSSSVSRQMNRNFTDHGTF
ncbi:hypothetical protein DEM27_15400 [Metarhizobium album]|uniref:Uncharacterized protein n=1 Tax=Metarhizobium album TaxID=2182425 RepID=A0A2U2DQ59_9HYPH|nr:hypothetical protein [Rhizobium album]PWE55440.1 hypothetical protein DEM27_15400 [Rhizobium album]